MLASSRRKKLVSMGNGFTLVELLVVVAIIGVLFGLLLPAVQAAREAARRTQCSNQLRDQTLGLINYESQHQHFPAGARLHDDQRKLSISWRVLVLPFIEQVQLYEQIEPLPDGGAANWSAKSEAFPFLQCPSVPDDTPKKLLSTGSNYAAIAGASRNDELIALETNSCGNCATDGILYVQSQTTTQQIEDGLSSTLLLGERTYVFRDWMTGAVRSGSPTNKICSGSVKNIIYPINASFAEFGYHKADFDAPPAQRKTLLNDLHFGSAHPGGAYFSFADGHVVFLNDELDFTVYQDFATRNGGEPVEVP